MESDTLQLSYAGHYLFVENSKRVLHRHRGVELVFYQAGVCQTCFESGEDFNCPAGQVLVTPPGLAHLQYNNTPDCETYYLVLEESPVLHPEDFPLRMINLGNDTISEEWFRQVFELSENHEQQTASSLLELLWRRLVEIENQSKERRNFHPALLKAIDQMNRHYSDEITVSGLAKYCSVSVSMLNFLFNRQFKLGPSRYLLALRMRKARLLLLDNRYRISEVAEKVGFQSANYFARTFKAYHGITPEAYRNGPPEFADKITFLE